MHRGFTKLFNTIVTSTIWSEDDKTRIVWITMLAIADAQGIVSASVPGLADVSRVSVDSCRAAITKLSDVDKDSRTKDHDGRRIEDVDGGWRILNYQKYRRMLNEEERREYKARWIAKKRVDKSRQVSTPRRHKSTLSTQAEAEAEAEKKRVGANKLRPAPLSPEELVAKYKPNPAYATINVQLVYNKMLNHCKLRGKQPTERRFVDWLNREDKPISGNIPSKPKEGRDPYEPMSDKLWQIKYGQG